MEKRRCGVPGSPIVKLVTEILILTGLDGNDVPLVTVIVGVPGETPPPPSDPPPLHEARLSKSVAQATTLMSD